MKLSVITVAGNDIASLSVDPSAGLEQVLAALREKTGSPYPRVRLLHGSEELAPGCSVQDVGAVEGSRLTLIALRPLVLAVVGAAESCVELCDSGSGECLQSLEVGPNTAEIELSHQGTHVLTIALMGSEVNLWRVPSGEHIATLRHEDRVVCEAFSPSDCAIVTAWGRLAQVWCSASGESLCTLRGHEKAVNSATFSSGGCRVVTGSVDGTARVWSATTGECLRTLRGHNDSVNSAAFSPDGGEVVTSSADTTAKIWSTATGGCLQTLRGHGNPLLSAVYSTGGGQVLTTALRTPPRLWSTTTGDCLTTLQVLKQSAARSLVSICHAAYSPDGREVLVWEGPAAVVCCAATGEAVHAPLRHACNIRFAVFSPDGRQVLTVGGSLARLWDAESGECARELKTVRGLAHIVPEGLELSAPVAEQAVSGKRPREEQLGEAGGG